VRLRCPADGAKEEEERFGFLAEGFNGKLGREKRRLKDILGRSGARFGTKVNDISCGQSVESNVRL
jgi:hypothetical protein